MSPVLVANDAIQAVVTAVDVLTTDQVRLVAEEVRRLRPHWQIRDEVGAAYTLGASINLDHRWPSLYLAKAKVCNAVMGERLGWLYERISAILSDELGRPSAYAPSFGLPGFNIYRTTGGLNQTGNIHCDRQYSLIADWPLVDFSETVSFTLSVALPRSGGGLNYWDLRFGDVPRLDDPAERREFFERCRPRYQAYTEGRMVIQHGEFYHQLARTIDPGDDDERITLQGHGVRSGDGWLLYW